MYVGWSRLGALFPTAVLVPVILTTSNNANGISGAVDVGPAADGLCAYCESCFAPPHMLNFPCIYYVRCD